MTCQHCQCAENLFTDKSAKRELKKYRKKGPRAATKKLIAALLPHAKQGESLLDIGGGIGAIQLAMLEAGADHATGVDASGGYLAAAREEAENRGFADRVAYQHGDFLDQAPQIDAHDHVTLDKVICCYPDFQALLKTSAEKSNKTLAIVFPRDIFLVKTMMGLGNLWFRIRGSSFRIYAHPSKEVFQLIQEQGFTKVGKDRHRSWQIAVFQRS